jgi:hypothetical protein
MTTTNKKRTLFGGFLSIATFVLLASCGNDTGSSKDEAKSLTDTSTKVSADTSAAAKSVTKKKRGKASGMISMDNTIKMEKDKEGVYNKAEKMPVYPGGETALSKFVEDCSG